ncbi:MAG: NAD(+)/NADH kinase [Ruminococcus sp.]|jgi:NAD+ kinase|nr:NAD(+)/NADH kinase [Ruminococcus sp.]
MKIIILPNLQKEHAQSAAEEAAVILRENGADVEIDRDFEAVREKAMPDADILIAVGGDGTILKTAVKAASLGIPLLGINTGRLGFMASAERDELRLLPRLVAGDYSVDRRIMIEAVLLRGGNIVWRTDALNEVLAARAYSKITDFEVTTGGTVVTRVRADGIMIATPTGSTAYALACGGPIAEPSADILQMTPVCPHSLFARTMIFKGSRILRITHSAESESAVFISADGKGNVPFEKGDILKVQKSDKYLKLIDIKGGAFFSAVNGKLMAAI